MALFTRSTPPAAPSPSGGGAPSATMAPPGGETLTFQEEFRQKMAALDAQDKENIARLLAYPVSPEYQQKITDPTPLVEERIEERRAIWKDKRPLPFDLYCIELDECPLFPRQYAAFKAVGMLQPESVIAKKRNLHQMVLIFGKGSGKDYMIAKFISWIFYVLCNLREDPAKFFNLAPYSRLSIINVASTAEQAKNVFFSQYLKRFISHKLFAGMNLVSTEERRAKAGEGKMTADSIIYRRTNDAGVHYECIGIYSMHSKATSLEGHNVFASVMDEADSMLDNTDRSNAEEVYTVLQSSSQRFQGNYFMAIISYPKVKDGFMMRKHAAALEEMRLLGPRASMYTDIAATWDVNPKFDRNDPDVQRQFRDNFAVANSLYGCIPMEAEDAFFDFPEQIDMAVDHTRSPCAIVTVEPYSIMLDNGTERYFVTGNVGQINRVPGYSYYLGGDAGAKKDAYALAIFHVDTSIEGFSWLCPDCGTDHALRQGADYVKHEFGTRRKYDAEIMCQVCYRGPQDFIGGWAGGTVSLQNWYERTNRNESALRDSEGRTYEIGHMYEDLIVRIKPVRATNSDPTSEGSKNKLVYFPGIREMCRKLIEGLGVTASRFDPHQTMDITQELMKSTGGDIGELSQSNPEQLRRASFVKSMLHAGNITLLPNVDRDIEWKRLMLIRGAKIDHPDGGSKDLWDAESMAIWTAATNRCNQLEIGWMG